MVQQVFRDVVDRRMLVPHLVLCRVGLGLVRPVRLQARRRAHDWQQLVVGLVSLDPEIPMLLKVLRQPAVSAAQSCGCVHSGRTRESVIGSKSPPPMTTTKAQ